MLLLPELHCIITWLKCIFNHILGILLILSIINPHPNNGRSTVFNVFRFLYFLQFQLIGDIPIVLGEIQGLLRVKMRRYWRVAAKQSQVLFAAHFLPNYGCLRLEVLDLRHQLLSELSVMNFASINGIVLMLVWLYLIMMM